MVFKRLISSGLGASRKVDELLSSEEDSGLIYFSLFLYCLGIPNHDDFGQISAMAEDWKFNVLPVSKEPVEKFKKALSLLVKVNLLELSICKKVLRYVDSDKIQYYRKDRNRKNMFTETRYEDYKVRQLPKSNRERTMMQKEYEKTKKIIIFSYDSKKREKLLKTLESIKDSCEELNIFSDMIEKGYC